MFRKQHLILKLYLLKNIALNYVTETINTINIFRLWWSKTHAINIKDRSQEPETCQSSLIINTSPSHAITMHANVLCTVTCSCFTVLQKKWPKLLLHLVCIGMAFVCKNFAYVLKCSNQRWSMSVEQKFSSKSVFQAKKENLQKWRKEYT